MTDQVSSQLPNREAPLFEDGRLLSAVWYNFMTFMASLKGKDAEQIAVGSSPYAYEATGYGQLHVAAGPVTVSSVVLQRGGISLACPTDGFVPVAAGDIVTVTFTGAGTPDITFLPNPRT